MMYFRWLIQIPVFFLSSIAAWIIAPIAPLFAKNYSLKGTAFWWCTTPQTDLRGDPDHQEKYHHKNSYFQQVHWILRNPAVNFQKEYLGVHVEDTDTVETIGDEESKDYGGSYWQYIVRDGKRIAWMYYCIKPYSFWKGKAFRALIGWKTWDAHVKDPLQMTFRITPVKSFTPKQR